MEILLENDDIRISIEPGSNYRAVVSFAGVGHALGGIQIEGFRKSLDTQDKANTIFFIIDKKRTWYNRTFTTALETVSREIERRGFSEVYTLGNSMGGFGAILFGEYLPKVVRSIAFSPQSSVNPEIVPFEHRWDAWVSKIDSWVVPDLIPIVSGKIEHYLFLGMVDANDLLHFKRFRSCIADSRLILFALTHCGHNVALFLKERVALTGILSALISGAPNRLEAVSRLMSDVRFEVYRA